MNKYSKSERPKDIIKVYSRNRLLEATIPMIPVTLSDHKNWNIVRAAKMYGLGSGLDPVKSKRLLTVEFKPFVASILALFTVHFSNDDYSRL